MTAPSKLLCKNILRQFVRKSAANCFLFSLSFYSFVRSFNHSCIKVAVIFSTNERTSIENWENKTIFQWIRWKCNRQLRMCVFRIRFWYSISFCISIELTYSRRTQQRFVFVHENVKGRQLVPVFQCFPLFLPAFSRSSFASHTHTQTHVRHSMPFAIGLTGTTSVVIVWYSTVENKPEMEIIYAEYFAVLDGFFAFFVFFVLRCLVPFFYVAMCYHFVSRERLCRCPIRWCGILMCVHL